MPPANFSDRCTCKTCPVHAETYEHRADSPLCFRKILAHPQTSNAIFDTIVKEIEAHQDARKGTPQGVLFNVVATAIKTCAIQAGFARAGGFLLVLYEDLVYITNREDEMQTFLMLGYLRKIVTKVLTGFTEMWTVRLAKEHEDEEKPDPPMNAQKQCLENEIKKLQQSAEDNAGTPTAVYSTSFVKAYQRVGVTPGFGWAEQVVEAFQEDILDGEMSFRQVWDLTRYMMLLMTEFKVELMNVALANKDMVEMVEIAEQADSDCSLAEKKGDKAKEDGGAEEISKHV